MSKYNKAKKLGEGLGGSRLIGLEAGVDVDDHINSQICRWQFKNWYFFDGKLQPYQRRSLKRANSNGEYVLS